MEHFEILIMGTKPSEVWVIGGLTSFIFARFVSLDWWMLTVVGVWRYYGHGIIFVSCSVMGLKGRKKRCCLANE